MNSNYKKALKKKQNINSNIIVNKSLHVLISNKIKFFVIFFQYLKKKQSYYYQNNNICKK